MHKPTQTSSQSSNSQQFCILSHFIQRCRFPQSGLQMFIWALATAASARLMPGRAGPYSFKFAIYTRSPSDWRVQATTTIYICQLVLQVQSMKNVDIWKTMVRLSVKKSGGFMPLHHQNELLSVNIDSVIKIGMLSQMSVHSPRTK